MKEKVGGWMDGIEVDLYCQCCVPLVPAQRLPVSFSLALLNGTPLRLEPVHVVRNGHFHHLVQPRLQGTQPSLNISHHLQAAGT